MSAWRDLEEKIIIPRRKPLWQAAAVATFFGVSYLAIDQGVQGAAHPAADRVTSQSPALSTDTYTDTAIDKVEPAEPNAPLNTATSTFDPLPVPSASDNRLRERESGEAARSTSLVSATPTSRRARRAERRRAAAAERAALAAEASKGSGDNSKADADARPLEIRRPITTPVIDETITAPGHATDDSQLERMQLQ